MNRRDALKLGLGAALVSTAARAGAPAKPAKKRLVGVLVFEGVEALDFCGPYEVFSIAHRHDAPAPGDKPGAMGRMEMLFDVRVVAATTAPVTARGGLKVVPAESFESCPQLDTLVVPGGTTVAALKGTPLIAWVARQGAKAELVTSVCTGSFVLAEAGLLDGKRSATHQLSLDAMRKAYPKVTVVPGERVVEDGNVCTAAGVSSGLDLALRIVARLHGPDAAGMVSTLIEYPPPAESAPRK